MVLILLLTIRECRGRNEGVVRCGVESRGEEREERKGVGISFGFIKVLPAIKSQRPAFGVGGKNKQRPDGGMKV